MNMKKVGRLGLWIILMFFAGACLDTYLPGIVLQDSGVLVVDGFLIGNDSTRIKLSRTQTLDSEVTSVSEPGAHVEIQGANGDKYVLIEEKAGLYVAPQLDLDLTQQYKLRIVTQHDQEYQSELVNMKVSPPLDSVTKTELPEHDRIGFYLYTHDPNNKTQFYYWTFDETWKFASMGYSVYYFENGQILPRKSASEIMECYRTQYNNNFYLGSTEGLAEDVVYHFPLMEIPQYSIKLYFGYSILVKQYALNKDAYAYYAITKKNSENLGTLFDPVPAQPTSNLRCVSNPSNAVIGFFSATTVQKRRIFFSRQEITGPTIPYTVDENYSPTGYENCPEFLFPPDQMTAENLNGKLIGDKRFDLVTFELIGYTVAPEECLDCRFKGTTTPPDYWK